MRLSKLVTKFAKKTGEEIAVGVVAEVIIALAAGWIINKITAKKQELEKAKVVETIMNIECEEDKGD